MSEQNQRQTGVPELPRLVKLFIVGWGRALQGNFEYRGLKPPHDQLYRHCFCLGMHELRNNFLVLLYFSRVKMGVVYFVNILRTGCGVDILMLSQFLFASLCFDLNERFNRKKTAKNRKVEKMNSLLSLLSGIVSYFVLVFLIFRNI